MRNTSSGNKKFEDALELLNEAAREKKEEIQSLINTKYEKVKEVLEETKGTIGDGEEKVKKTFDEVGKAVKKNPLLALGGAALGALLLGYFLGSSKKDKQ